jgi:tRNA/tmRNA/rRNA uracil-C5-methylase (TrmA/RlmC/RlmD family)
VEEAFASGALASLRPQALVLDPPRGGLEPAAREGLPRLAAPRVIYVSCDPATLARDVAVLADRGYELVALEGFDLFPQTAHVEAVACLRAGG